MGTRCVVWRLHSQATKGNLILSAVMEGRLSFQIWRETLPLPAGWASDDRIGFQKCEKQGAAECRRHRSKEGRLHVLWGSRERRQWRLSWPAKALCPANSTHRCIGRRPEVSSGKTESQSGKFRLTCRAEVADRNPAQDLDVETPFHRGAYEHPGNPSPDLVAGLRGFAFQANDRTA